MFHMRLYTRMKKMQLFRLRTPYMVLFVFLSAFLISCGIVESKFARSVTATRGSIEIEGITDKIVIRRDNLGIPVIEASNEEDLFFGSGYVAASDRLWQMYLMSMAMQGRLSEIVGDEMLPLDIFMRCANARERAETELSKLDVRLKSLLEAYAKGVNSYLEKNPNLPAEFVLTRYRPQPWRPIDTFYVFGMLDMSISFNFIEELAFIILASKLGYEKAALLFPVYPDEELPLGDARSLEEIPHRELLQTSSIASTYHFIRKMKKIFPFGIPASNNWAVGPSRTKNGKSIVCNDTHLMLMIPNSWMLLHLKSPTYDAAGVTVPGIPIVALGTNGKIAWGATMVMADSEDLFIEKLKKINGKTHYLYKSNWIPVKERREAFKIKGGNEVYIPIEETIHGTLINTALERMPYPPMLPVQPLPMKSEYGISIAFAIENGARTLEGFYSLGKCKNAKEARKAILKIESIYLNIVYGDEKNIGWQVTGAFPKRKKGRGLFPSPGWTGEYDWIGFEPTSNNPHLENPTEGFIGTANNRTVKTHSFPLTASWYHPDRAERIAEILKNAESLTFDDMVRMQYDTISPMAKKIQRMLYEKKMRDAVEKVAESFIAKDRARVARAFEMLSFEKFNGDMNKDSAPAAVIGAFVHEFTRKTFLDELGPEGGIYWQAFIDANMTSYGAPEDHLIVRERSPFFDDITTTHQETKADVVACALVNAMKLCEEKMGSNPDKWKWGILHTYHWKHDFTKKTRFFHGYFNRGPYPASGDVHTLNVTTFPWGENFDTWIIPAMRMVVDFSKSEPASFLTVPGQSGNPSSKHYDDMIPYFLNVSAHPMPFAHENIANQYCDVLELLPKKNEMKRQN
ncbi:MAG: penicillin acylase family protein [Spirochaetes bacterium]|nr:penicillin acylase family protein [Spirochaetota bacterium]